MSPIKAAAASSFYSNNTGNSNYLNSYRNRFLNNNRELSSSIENEQRALRKIKEKKELNYEPMLYLKEDDEPWLKSECLKLYTTYQTEDIKFSTSKWREINTTNEYVPIHA